MWAHAAPCSRLIYRGRAARTRTPLAKSVRRGIVQEVRGTSFTTTHTSRSGQGSPEPGPALGATEVEEKKQCPRTSKAPSVRPCHPPPRHRRCSRRCAAAGGITMSQLLEAGVHFGHQTKRWNPKMKPYIFGARNGIYIIDLQKTVRLARAGLPASSADVTARGGSVLFVGTKKQAQDVVAEEATPRRPVLRHQPLAGRHADQLQDHQAGHRPPQDAGEDGARTAPSSACPRRKSRSSSASGRSWRRTWAASRT